MTRRDLLDGIPAETIARFGLDRLPFDDVDRSVADLLSLDGRRVVVTGGGGADLGQAISRRLARLGARVAVLDVDTQSARRSRP